MKIVEHSQPAVAVRELAVSFSRWGQNLTAVDNLSLDIAPGQWLLLAGHNGAGKSTLLRAINGQYRAERGRILINGRDTADLKPSQLAQSTYMVHQDPLLGTAPLLTVFENLRVADPQTAPSSKSDLLEHYENLLSPIGLSGRLKQPTKLLSGGERQLLAMAIAGLRDPDIILLDEPLAALDPVNGRLCIDQIKRLHNSGKTIVQVAHELRELRNCADRIITMKNGQLVEDVTIQ